MNIKLTIPTKLLGTLRHRLEKLPWQFLVITPAIVTALISTAYYFFTDTIIAYGDAESHLNIAKRVVSSLTPGAAQLGGIWLPLPHLLMVPFVSVDWFWRTGLAGSIVGGVSYVITAAVVYKLVFFLTKHKWASVTGALLFIFNPNIMYLQSTAMTELPLIVFFSLSSYCFVRFIEDDTAILPLLGAAFFGFCAVLSRYDGWLLVLSEAGIIVLIGLIRKWQWKKIEGLGILFATLAFFGVFLWLGWDKAILGNALYFSQSEFSAQTQQQAWLAKGQLPAYHNIVLSFWYYFVTAMSDSGMFIFLLFIVGLIVFVWKKRAWERWLITLLLLVPFIFYVVTLYIGQSVIFIPHLTPVSFEWRLFNVRYGVTMIPVVSVFVGYLLYRSKLFGRFIIISLCLLQFGLYAVGYSKVQTYDDGVIGLSHAKRPDAEFWMKSHYDGGLVLVDDYARTISVIRSGIPMEKIIYIGNKPYWQESLVTPQKYATWIVMQKNDSVWTKLYDNSTEQDLLYKYFKKVYTSPEILIFRRQV
jgi:hypothetical protein